MGETLEEYTESLTEQIRRERAERLAYLSVARESIDKARYPEVSSDGEDIFNAGVDWIIERVEELRQSIDGD